jgi:hypothetical protein
MLHVLFVLFSLFTQASEVKAVDVAQVEADAKAIAEKNEKLGLHNESELGYIVVGGNAKSQSFSGKQSTWYQFDSDILKLNAHYLNTKAQNQTTRQLEGIAENWSASLRFEHIYIADTFNVFTQAGARGDRFIGVDFGQSYDVGAKYFWVSSEKIKLFSELGYQYLKEEFKDDSNPLTSSYNESHFIRLYSQIDYIHTDSVKFGLWVEYLPDIKEQDNYRFNFSPYMMAVLSDTFSLKFGYEGYYRNLPVAPNTIRFDYRHVTALIAKF